MRDTLAEAYTRTRGPVAYLDESYQAPDPVITTANTFYIFTAVVVHHEDMDELRKGLEDIAGGRYWHTRDALAATKGRQQTEDMLGFLADGSEACVIAHRVPVDATDHDAEQARRACYRGYGHGAGPRSGREMGPPRRVTRPRTAESEELP